MMDLDLETEYFNRLSERFTPTELVEILDVTIEDIWNAFYDKLIENHSLQLLVGMQEEE